MYEIAATTRFKKDLKTLSKRGYNMEPLTNVVHFLSTGKRLPKKYKEHI